MIPRVRGYELIYHTMSAESTNLTAPALLPALLSSGLPFFGGCFRCCS